MLKFFKSRIGRIFRSVLNMLIFLALCVLVLILISEDFASEVSVITTGGGISADALERRLGEEVKILIVYPAADDYAEKCAEMLNSRLGTNSSLKVTVLSDEDPSGTDTDLTVYLGHTNLNSESYVDAYMRLGPDGLEISHSENADGDTDRLFILAFNEERLTEGIERFVGYFLSVNRLYKTFASLYVTEKSGQTLSLPEKRRVCGNTFSLLALSYPGTDKYSLPALGTICKNNPSDILVFDGGIDFATDREGLCSGWESILASGAREENALAVYLPSAAYTSSVQLLSCDVLGSLNSGIPVYGTESRIIWLESEGGRPLGFILFLSDGADASEDLKYLEEIKALAERNVRHTLPVLVFMPAITKSVQTEALAAAEDGDSELFMNESTNSYISAYAEAVYPGLCRLGAEGFVFSAGYTNAGVYTDSGLRICGFTGSLDFSAPGLGGRFALDNSLRGALYISFDFSAEAGEIVNMKYIFASEYGLTVKNVG